MTGVFGLCWWSKMGGYSVQKSMLVCFSEKWTFLRLKTGGRIYFSGDTFEFALRKIFQHSFSPFISQHQITTIFFQEIRVIRSNHSCCYTYELTPVDSSPSHSCSQRNVFIFFKIPESNGLGLPILFIAVQSPSLHSFYQMLTVVLIKEYFGYLVVNFLIAEAVSKSVAYKQTSFLIFAGIWTWQFFQAFVYLLHLLFGVSKLRRRNIFRHGN